MKTSGFQGHELVQAGRFVVGCNYWASHAGTRMWEDWRSDIVTRDLRRLEQGGLQVLRVFPLWPGTVSPTTRAPFNLP